MSVFMDVVKLIDEQLKVADDKDIAAAFRAAYKAKGMHGEISLYKFHSNLKNALDGKIGQERAKVINALKQKVNQALKLPPFSLDPEWANIQRNFMKSMLGIYSDYADPDFGEHHFIEAKKELEKLLVNVKSETEPLKKRVE